jgi:hypothetical protein
MGKLRKSGISLAVMAVTALVVSLGLMGCSTANLPASATPEETNAALCKDAQLGFTIVEIALAKPNMTEAEKLYWAKYKAAVAMAVTNYCMKP